MPAYRNLYLLLALAFAALPVEQARSQETEWLAPLGQEHPLTGRIWHVAEGRFIELSWLEEQIPAADFLLLGETHNNPDHHRLQARLTAIALRGGRSAPVAFEMIDEGQRDRLDDYLKDNAGDASGLGKAIGWETSGWPDWEMYQPVAQAALEGGSRILPASLSRDRLRKIYSAGIKAALGEELHRTLDLDRYMPTAIREAKAEDIRRSHCNQLPEKAVGPMVSIQTVKDAYMAHILINADRGGIQQGAILIAGTGHTRTDYGVPYHLANLAPGKAILSIAMIEVRGGETDPAAYARAFRTESLPFDFVWFTPRISDEDACEKYAEQLNKVGK